MKFKIPKHLWTAVISHNLPEMEKEMKEGEIGELECPECHGTTIMFKGKGLDMQYKICPYWKQPGHKSEGEIEQEIARIRRNICPLGRWAIK